MKRIFCLLCAFVLLFLTACQPAASEPTDTPEVTPSPTHTAAAAPEPTPTPEATPEPTPEPEFEHPLTGVRMYDDISGKKPVAIMLNNLRDALPQQGNSQADIIYEVLAEGGITRMLAVYQDPSALGLIGSVRSARQYYWEIAQGHDAVFIHAGGSPEFYDSKSALNAFTVDGVNGYYSGADTGMFWRDRERIAGHYYAYEHSLLTSGEAIAKMLAAQNLENHTDGYTYEMSFADDGTPEGGQSAVTVTVPFSNYKLGVFRYDKETGLYLVEEYDGPYIDGNDGSQVAITNLIVLQTSCTVVDDYGRIVVDLSFGSGYFACGGQIVPITWEKGARGNQFHYYDKDGDPLTLGRGKSYVCIIPTNRTVTAE